METGDKKRHSDEENAQIFPSKEKANISRRQLLAAGSWAAIALTLPDGVKASVEEKPSSELEEEQPGICKPSKASQPWYQKFREPRTLFSGPKKIIGEDLHVVMAKIAIAEPGNDNQPEVKERTVRTYNSEVPGPTFRLFPGDKLELKVFNELPRNVPVPDPDDRRRNIPPEQRNKLTSCKAAGDKDVPHCFNTTNVHFHGLHVSPLTTGDDPKIGVSSDDVHVRIPPKDDDMDKDGWPSERQYRVQLPAFHAPGTHWYHAHVHGSTAIQVANGMAGALIIEEPEDQKIQVDKDLVWMVQEIIEDGDGRLIYRGSNRGSINEPPTRFAVNSLVSPTIKMRVNEIHRWRLINATGTPRGFMNVAIKNSAGFFMEPVDTGGEPPPDAAEQIERDGDFFHLMAVDGITFYGKKPVPVKAPGHFMAPANRADLLVKFSKPGTYYVWKLLANVKFREGRLRPVQRLKDEILAIIEVDEPEMPKRKLPLLPGIDKRPGYLDPIKEGEITKDENREKKERKFDFKVIGPPPQFLINDLKYGNRENPAPNTEVSLGNVEEWDLTNTPVGDGPNNIDPRAASHPFHIHVNPFQVVGEKIDPKGLDNESNWMWRDTVTVMPNTPKNVNPLKIRTRFLTYHGKFVLHCHILIHEDVGMMQDVTVTGKGYGPGEEVEEFTR